ncbi:hypothetical protein L2E82_46163 [Cichorium intybus]|uniref:Uncharacterized protein n=1 Tax=Cichorium intybus TaxID=13427 RepID=A0ACB8YSZ4_CICIN|nr:hypothetical protein L2E82_46163 [Cichorium intybus]
MSEQSLGKQSVTHGIMPGEYNLDNSNLEGNNHDIPDEFQVELGPLHMGHHHGPVDMLNQSGLGHGNSVALEQSLLVKSKSRSLNLNEDPKNSTTGESRTWINREKPTHATESPNQFINQPEMSSTTDSHESSMEVDAIVEIWEMIDFQFDGNREQVRLFTLVVKKKTRIVDSSLSHTYTQCFQWWCIFVYYSFKAFKHRAISCPRSFLSPSSPVPSLTLNYPFYPISSPECPSFPPPTSSYSQTTSGVPIS